MDGLPPDVTCAGCGGRAHEPGNHPFRGSWRVEQDFAGVIHWTHRCARVSPHADHWRLDPPAPLPGDMSKSAAPANLLARLSELARSCLGVLEDDLKDAPKSDRLACIEERLLAALQLEQIHRAEQEFDSHRAPESDLEHETEGECMAPRSIADFMRGSLDGATRLALAVWSKDVERFMRNRLKAERERALATAAEPVNRDEVMQWVQEEILPGLERNIGKRIVDPNSGAGRIAAERHRQIEVENWTPEHGNAHIQGELSAAAGEYIDLANLQIARACRGSETVIPPASSDWPFATEWWKPSDDPIRNLEKAGALLCAEIDRLLLARAVQP